MVDEFGDQIHERSEVILLLSLTPQITFKTAG